MRVGIPRALLYYNYYPLWRTFFDALGVTVVVSPPTDRQILSDGAARVTGETCLPAKVYLGHVLALVARVDYIFVPLIRTLGPEQENCPRLLGLADIVKASVPEAPPLLVPEIDLEGGTRKVAAAVYDLGRHFALNPLLVKKAADRALEVQRSYEAMLSQGVPLPVALTYFDEGRDQSDVSTESPTWAGSTVSQTLRKRKPDGSSLPRVALLGHAYNLYDEYVNHRLVSRLRALGIDLVTSDAVNPKSGRESIEGLEWKQYWSYEYELIGAAAYYLARGELDGLVAVMTFGCGPDAAMVGSLQELSARHGVPLMNVVLDEHTGEAGLITRLEAFFDMLSRRTLKIPS